MTFIVGLTGGIGSGKTAVSDRFAALGIKVVDADVCARVVVEKDTPALAKIADHFGDAILDKEGNLDRAQLRQRIFRNESERKWLEALLHPLIFEEMMAQLNSATSPYAILVSPLLIESGQDAICLRVLVVDAPETLQLQRTVSRDKNSTEQVQAIMATQASRQQRIARANDVIVNDTDLSTLQQRVDELHKGYLALHEIT